jgi:hypothetical protein
MYSNSVSDSKSPSGGEEESINVSLSGETPQESVKFPEKLPRSSGADKSAKVVVAVADWVSVVEEPHALWCCKAGVAESAATELVVVTCPCRGATRPRLAVAAVAAAVAATVPAAAAEAAEATEGAEAAVAGACWDQAAVNARLMKVLIRCRSSVSCA